jgi:serine/threonine protein phosphatase PrpC
MRYATRVDIGQVKARKGAVNEDSVSTLVFDETHRDSQRQAVGAFVLADGAGGHDDGDVASYLATTVVPDELSDLLLRLGRGENAILGELSVDESELPEPPAEDEIAGAIESAIQAAHEEIKTHPDLGDGATTIVVGVYTRGRLHVGWVGDSRAYVINQSNRSIEQITQDHSVVEQYVQEGSVSEAVARVHDNNNVITRAVGGSNSTVETNVVDVYGDDVVLFTSDGLIDAYDRSEQLYQKFLRNREDDAASIEEEILETVVTDDEILERVLRSDTLGLAAEQLIGLAKERGGADNISVLMFSDPDQQAITESANPDQDRTYQRTEEEHDLEEGETITVDTN